MILVLRHFLIVATLITKNSKLKIQEVGLNFYRTGLLDVLKKMKAKIFITNKKIINGELVGDIEVLSSKLISTSVSKKIIPRLIDELPILFVAASFAVGKSKFSGLEELKFKESDRLKSMALALKDAGVSINQKQTLSKFLEIINIQVETLSKPLATIESLCQCWSLD